MSAGEGRGRIHSVPLAAQDAPGEAPAALRPIADLLEDAQRIIQKELSQMQGRSRTGLMFADDMAKLGQMIRALKAIEAKIGDGGDEADPAKLTTEQLQALAGRKR